MIRCLALCRQGLPRSLLTWQTALAAILEQRVTGVEARGAWRALVTEHGTPAPGPVPERMQGAATTAAAVLQVPSWDWRRYGVDRQRVQTIRRLASVVHVLRRAEGGGAGARARTADGDSGDRAVDRRGDQFSRAFGDSDAVSVGDYHLARNVTFALTGRTDGTDEDMLELLAVYAGHRHRAVRLVNATSDPASQRSRMRLPGPG